MVRLLTHICVTRLQWVKIRPISRIRTRSSLRRIMLLLCMIDFTHIFQDYFTGTETIERLPQFQINNPEEYGQINEMNPLVTDKNYNKIKHTLSGLFWLATLDLTGPLWGESTGCITGATAVFVWPLKRPYSLFSPYLDSLIMGRHHSLLNMVLICSCWRVLDSPRVPFLVWPWVYSFGDHHKKACHAGGNQYHCHY